MKKRELTGMRSSLLQTKLFKQYSIDHIDDVRQWESLLTEELWLDFPFYTNGNRVHKQIRASVIITSVEEDE